MLRLFLRNKITKDNRIKYRSFVDRMPKARVNQTHITIDISGTFPEL